MTRSEWILTQVWRHGTNGGAVVCDIPLEGTETDDTYNWYGGEVVFESCTHALREHIIALHNADLAAKGASSQ